MSVGRYDHASQLPDLDGLLARIGGMLREGRCVLTPEVEELEAALAAYVEVPHAVGVGSGTDALVLCLRALGIGPGDRVVTQANTFHATVAAIVLAGAEPVLVDADEETFVLAPEGLEAAWSSSLRAMIPVHLYGRPCPMDDVLAFARRHDLVVVEDAAQAIGARSKSVPIGSMGDGGCFSFHPSKNLAAAGDGGAVVCRSPEVDERLRVLRSLGQTSQNVHDHVGLNSKLDAIQAVVLTAKLPYLEGWNERRRELARAYRERLADLPLTFQAEDPEDLHVYHLFQVRTPRRDELQAHLRSRGIDAVVRYPTPVHLQRSFADRGWRRGQFPVAECLAVELLALPLHPTIGESAMDEVCEGVRSFFEG